MSFASGSFSNFWYKSASPSFLVEYMKRHVIQNPEEYRHLEVPEDFADAQEIEQARPESFLFQSGYLTIEKREEQSLTLDYPNREVLDSLSRIYLEYGKSCVDDAETRQAVCEDSSSVPSWP